MEIEVEAAPVVIGALGYDKEIWEGAATAATTTTTNTTGNKMVKFWLSLVENSKRNLRNRITFLRDGNNGR